MQFQHHGEPVTVFTISPRTKDVDLYWRNIEQCIDLSEQFGATGILLFEGNDTLISPWAAAQTVFERSAGLSPLVAVNPIYMHPFTVAKLVNSYAQLYQRRTYLNMITGTALSYLQAMDDELAHDQRYERLREYTELIWQLMTSDDAVSYAGDHYQVNKLRLDPPTPTELLPQFFFAGASQAASETAAIVGGTQMKMLPPTLSAGLSDQPKGLHFGIVCREQDAQAWQAARQIFPEDRRNARRQQLTMNNTDSQWKQRLMQAAQMEQGAAEGFWLGPFANMHADCPYFVGSVEQTATMLAQLVQGGVRDFILDLPCSEIDFAHTHSAFQLAAEKLAVV